MKKLSLVVERSKDGLLLWGHVKFDDDLIVDFAKTLGMLQKKMKKLLHYFHQVDPAQVKFRLSYDNRIC